jgi:hypothetical protein
MPALEPAAIRWSRRSRISFAFFTEALQVKRILLASVEGLEVAAPVHA